MPEIDKLLTEVGKSQFTYRLDSKTLALLYLIPSWLVCPNCPYAINQFKLVQLTNQELVGAIVFEETTKAKSNYRGYN